MKPVLKKNCNFLLIITIFILNLLTSQLIAKPFLEINKVDAKSSFPEIQLNISVMGNNKTWIKGLTEEHLTIYEDGYRVNYVKVINKKSNDDVFHLVFSVDSSKSISKSFLKKIKKSAANIITNSDENQKIALYRFNDEVIMLNNFSKDRLNLLKNIDNIKRHGTKTLLFDSIYDSIELISKIEGNHKAVIIFTDGKDEGSSVNSDDVISFAKENSLPVYFMCLKNSHNIRTLSRISKLTGGKLIYGNNPDNVVNMYRTIAKMIKNQYLVKYFTRLKNDGKEHTIEARLNYASIKDRDKKNIKFSREFFLDFKFPSLIESLLIVLIFLIFIFLIIFIIFVFRKGTTIAKQTIIEKQLQRNENYSNLLNPYNNEQNQPISEKDELITPEDTEYNYYSAWLVQKDGPESGKKFPIYWDEITLGRGKENTIVIEDNAVSLKHAKVKKTRKGYTLFDMASDNGTILNNKKLLRPKPLFDWDEIQIGRTVLVFRGSKIK